jgi:hypothetical protein
MSNSEKAINFVLGSLSADERKAVSTERLYNSELDQQILATEQLYSGLQAQPKLHAKVPEVWSKIRATIDQSDAAFAKLPNQVFIDGGWQPHGPGIEFKTLWQEGTILIRCVPGGSEDAHNQPEDQDEHILVVAGDLHMGGRLFETGDYICIPAGSTHARMHSEGGCILFTQYLQ